MNVDFHLINFNFYSLVGWSSLLPFLFPPSFCMAIVGGIKDGIKKQVGWNTVIKDFLQLKFVHKMEEKLIFHWFYGFIT